MNRNTCEYDLLQYQPNRYLCPKHKNQNALTCDVLVNVLNRRQNSRFLKISQEPKLEILSYRQLLSFSLDHDFIIIKLPEGWLCKENTDSFLC